MRNYLILALFLLFTTGLSCCKKKPVCKTCGWSDSQGGAIVGESSERCGDEVSLWLGQEPRSKPQASTTTISVRSLTKQYPVCTD